MPFPSSGGSSIPPSPPSRMLPGGSLETDFRRVTTRAARAQLEHEIHYLFAQLIGLLTHHLRGTGHFTGELLRRARRRLGVANGARNGACGLADARNTFRDVPGGVVLSIGRLGNLGRR